MRKSHKVLLVFLIAFAAAIVAFTKTFNSLAAKNREQVLQELQRFLGKEATFDRLEASLWGGLGFSAKEFRIADDPHFAATPVVHAQELRLGVSLLPLLLGKIVIDSLTFQAPEFQIITDERGLLNLTQLAGQKKETRAVPRSQTPSPERKVLTVDFLVGKINVKNGRIDFIDRSVKEPAEIRVKNVEMEVKGFNPSEKTRVRFAAAVTEGLGHDVRIDGELGPLRQPHDWLQQPVELAMRFDSLSATLLARALPFLRNRIPRELDVTGPLSLQANLEGTFNRPRITDIVLRIPLFGSSNYNAILEGSVESPEGGPWTEAQLKGKLTLNSINLTQLRSLPLLKQILPVNLATEGTLNAYSQFEGTWANLRVGALIRGEKGEFRYADWFRKPAGNPAEFKARISRQKNALVLHDSELSLGNSKLRLSGVVTEAPDPRLQLKLRSDSSHLPTWWQLVSPLSFYSVAGTIHWDIVLQKNLASADDWNIQGKLNLADAEFKHKETGRQIDHLNAVVSFLGRDASLGNGSFRLGSSRITVVAEGPVLTERRARYNLQAAELNLMDLPTFPASKATQIKNVTARGEIQWQTLPLITGTIASSEGTLEDIPYRELRGDITWSPEGITFKNLSLQAFEGVLRSDGYWPVAVEKPQRFTFKSQIESIELSSLLKQKLPQLKNRIEGQLNFRGQFDAARQNGVTVAEALQGSGESIVHNGSIRDFNLIAKILPGGGGDPALSKGSSRLPASLAALVDRPYTPFDTLKANFKVEGQRIRTDDLLLVTPDYTITGAGWVGFDRTTQWNGLLVLSARITQELQREYKMIRYLLDRRGRLSIAFRAEGKFPNVKVKPENRAVAQVLRRSFPQKDDTAGSGKGSEKNEKRSWLPEPLEQLLRQ